jgi:arylsulfatase A-like enzyme
MKPPKTFSSILLFVLPAIVLSFQSGCKGQGPAPEPNVVMIVIDTLRADHLPFYGYDKNTAPFLSKLAKDSVVFENTFAVTSWTAPSTASIFTSLYPFQHGVVTGYFASKGFKLELNRIPDKVTTIPELMKANGYKTYGLTNNINIGKAIGFDRGFDYFVRFFYKDEPKMNRKLAAWSRNIKKQKKYFLYLHYNDPHSPYHQREPWYEKKEKYKADMISRYDSEINYVDEKIRKMYELFGWDKNTLIIIVSDHGEELWDRGKLGHGYSLYTEVVKVPFIMYFPPEQRVRKRFKTVTSNIDVMPTLRGFLRFEPNPVESGRNLMPLIKGKEKQDKNRDLFGHLILRYRDKEKKTLKKAVFKSVLSTGWQYIFRYNDVTNYIFKRELFNLAADPAGSENLYEKNKTVAGRMLHLLGIFEKNCKRFSSRSRKMDLDKEKMEELRTLGYVK